MEYKSCKYGLKKCMNDYDFISKTYPEAIIPDEENEYCDSCVITSATSFVRDKGYIDTCKFGYEDCVVDPAYLRRYDLEWYMKLKEENSFPCKTCIDGNNYEDEDK